MKKNLFIVLIIAIIISAASTKSFTYDYGPPSNNVNISSVNCTQAYCHSDHKLNSGSGNIKVSISGQSKPYVYHLDSTYTVDLVITDSKAKTYGFQAAVVDNTTKYATIGSISTITSNTSTISSSRYIEQNTADSTHHFRFKWKAPHAGTGLVRIYACGNASDGNLTSTGDYIYSTIDTLKYKAISTDVHYIASAGEPLVYYFENKLHVKLATNTATDNMLSVYDLNGRVVMSTKVTTDMDINVNDLANGLYIAAIINENGLVSTKKFIKQ